MLSWHHRPIRIRILTQHLRRVHRLDVRRGQMERSGVVEPDRVLDNELAFGYVTVIRTEAFEGALFVRGPDRALLFLALREQGRVAAEAAPEHGAPRRDRIVDDDPGHVRLRLDFEMHARDIAPAPPAFRLLL